jgi:aerobic carbon-monoxide dehydrogenase small subunit
VSKAKTETVIELHLNGEWQTTNCRYADTLLRVLREQLGLFGAKPGCENGDCGACTVLLNGTPMKSCLILAVEAAQQKILTAEGLRGTLIQQAFVEQWAFQCGYCTPGFIMNAYALTESHPEADDALIAKWLQSNICRCTSYQEIETAVKSVLEEKHNSLRDQSG